jgi:hypothetical protein
MPFARELGGGAEDLISPKCQGPGVPPERTLRPPGPEARSVLSLPTSLVGEATVADFEVAVYRNSKQRFHIEVAQADAARFASRLRRSEEGG